MKRILYIAATALVCASCFHVNTNYKGGKNSLKGEGELVSKSFDLKDFDQIVINGHGDVDFIQSSTYEVTVNTQANVLEWLDYKVEGSTLILETKDHRDIRASKYEIVVQAPELKKLTVNGATDFNVRSLRMDGNVEVQVNGAGDLDFDNITCDSFSVEVNGAADANLHAIDIRKDLKVQVNGAGDVNISGNAKDVTLEVHGAGDIDARGLNVSGEVSKHTAGLAKINI